MAKIENSPVVAPQKGSVIEKTTYVISGILVVGWAVGFLVLHAGNQVHLLLLLAMVTISANIILEG
jgi:Family of unknown function (DUF5670)